ncbi:MAG: protein kinase [Anaerolineales bacterium]|uniref:protein kinase domain-containing protein n=1 Tax=Candidatus Villigracilis proximus TaxID=3140683 RepID=UPI003136F830|nr:protein kinase [Anaerolineales bacterium]
MEAESARLRAISHPNIVPYLGLHQTPTTAFLLEEWINGPSLTEILNRKPISAVEALVYTKAICSALEALHKQNYLHLHIAPELIHINKRGEIFLGGIGAAQQINSIIEYPHDKYPNLYFSPEQLNGESLSPASDIYSLAALLYELTTAAWINGKDAPKTNEAIRKAHLDLAPPAPIKLNKNIPDHFSRMLLGTAQTA